MRTLDASDRHRVVVGLIGVVMLGSVSRTALAQPSVAGTRSFRLADRSLVTGKPVDEAQAAVATQKPISGSVPVELVSGDDSLIRAKELYWSAAFDEALALLERLKIDASSTQGTDVAVYRLLCLVALERLAEARQAIESIVLANPFYQPMEADVAPRTRALFREVRRGLLPSIVQQAYANANAAFDRTDREAVAMFDRLLALLHDPDIADLPELAELRASVTRLHDRSQAVSVPQRLTDSGAVLASDSSAATAGAAAAIGAVAADVSSPSGSIAPLPAIAPAAEELARGAEEKAIYVVLGWYLSAFNSLDARAAVTVWPSLDWRTLARAFSQLAEQELTFDGCHVEITGTQAVASCQGRARYLPKVGNKAPRARGGRWTFKLRNTAERWMIEGVAIR